MEGHHAQDDAGHIDWLSAARKKDWHYWRRYRDYQKSSSRTVVVMASTGPPATSWGLLETRCGPIHGIGAARS